VRFSSSIAVSHREFAAIRQQPELTRSRIENTAVIEATRTMDIVPIASAMKRIESLGRKPGSEPGKIGWPQVGSPERRLRIAVVKDVTCEIVDLFGPWTIA